LNLSLLSKWFKQAFESIDELTEILDESLLETDSTSGFANIL